MKGTSWKIYWNEYTTGAYLYGSEIYFHTKEDVEYKNELIQPGAVIKCWHSKVNYQSMRVEPALPMIDGEGRYHISLEASVEPADGLLLKLIFYDRYDTEVGIQIVRDGSVKFQCPLSTFSYQVQLIDAGATQFHFHSITITEISDEEPETI